MIGGGTGGKFVARAVSAAENERFYGISLNTILLWSIVVCHNY